MFCLINANEKQGLKSRIKTLYVNGSVWAKTVLIGYSNGGYLEKNHNLSIGHTLGY